MTAPDWVPEPNSVSLPTSSDLFEGELYGEELIDLYSSAVGGVAQHESNHDAPQSHQVSQDGSNAYSQNNNDNNQVIPKTEGAEAHANAGLGGYHPPPPFLDANVAVPAQADPMVTNTSYAATGQNNSSSSTVGVKREAVVAPQGTPPAKMQATAPQVKQEPAISHHAAGPVPVGAPPQIMPVPGSTVPSHAAPTATLMPPPAPVMQAPLPAPSKTKATPKGSGAANATGKTTAKLSSVKVAIVVSAKPSNKKTKAAPKGTQSAKTSAKKKKSAPKDDSDDDFDGMDMSGATEADFKSVAEAAVSSLIQNTKADLAAVSASGASVDTSTAHVKALTGSNWVAAFAGPQVAPVTPAPGPDAKVNKSRKNLSADERARQNRDRNREHARNTRLRKKAYVEELKKTLAQLVAQRDLADVEKNQAAQRELEQREVRFRVLEEFLNLRGRNESNSARWAAILEDGFTFTLPATNFREMVTTQRRKDDNADLEQVLSGVPEVMADSSNFAAFLQALGRDGYKGSGNDPITFQYHIDRANFFMDDNSAVLDWTASSVGAVQKGGKAELFVRGSIRSCFSPASNKLVSANMMLDTGSVLSQLHDLIDAHYKPVGADDVAAAQAASHEADAILDSIQMPHLGTNTTTRVSAATTSSAAAATPASGAPATVSCGTSVASSDGSL